MRWNYSKYFVSIDSHYLLRVVDVVPGVLVRPQLLVWAFWSYTIIDNVDNISSREIYFGEMKCTSWSLHSRNVVLESVF